MNSFEKLYNKEQCKKLLEEMEQRIGYEDDVLIQIVIKYKGNIGVKFSDKSENVPIDVLYSLVIRELINQLDETHFIINKNGRSAAMNKIYWVCKSKSE